jgi:hypothetical protein
LEQEQEHGGRSGRHWVENPVQKQFTLWSLVPIKLVHAAIDRYTHGNRLTRLMAVEAEEFERGWQSTTLLGPVPSISQRNMVKREQDSPSDTVSEI